MKMIFHTVMVLICSMALQAQASGGNGYDHDNGGDICENRFITVRNDLSAWIVKGGAAGLRLPAPVSLEQYVQKMLEKIQAGKVSCVDEKIFVGSAEKTCKNFSDADGTLRIQCNSKRFLETPESDQYVLVHHEYAGLAGFEVNDGEVSDYSISSQITGFLEDQIIKKLVVKPVLDPSIDPFDPASCTDEAMTLAEATQKLQLDVRQDLAPFSMFTRERWCDNESGCGDWKRIQNQLSHPDQTKTRNFMLIPDTGVLMLYAGLDGHVGVELATTPLRGDYSGQGAHLVCDWVGEKANYGCMVEALPAFETMGEASGTLGKHCARFTFKHRGFFADKAFFEMEGIYHNAALLDRGVWVERESVFLSRY